MSKTKKAVKRLQENYEFFTDPSISLEIYNAWVSKQPLAVNYDYPLVVTENKFDMARLQGLLKSNKSLVSIILHKKTSAQIEQWYVENPEALAQKNYRLQIQKIEALNKHCISYKQHLHTIIEYELKALPAKAPSTPFEKLHNLFQPGSPHSNLPGQESIELTPQLVAEDRSKLPPNSSQNLMIALKKFRLLNTLEQTLKSDQPIPLKVEQFERTFNGPQSRMILNIHRDSKGIRFLKAVGHILTLGIVSKIKNNTFKFWECKSQVFADTLQNKVNAIKSLNPTP